MIPVIDKIDITDNMGGEKTVMSVRAEDWKKLSGLLINLYSDTILAVIREYSTNAYDAHIEAGIDKPIKVTTPNAFNNLFVVQDFGSGMSKDDLQKTYAMFGASTKDTSNDFNGSMGLGSKSALTYTDSFTVISTKGGYTTTAIIGRDEEGNGIMEILAEEFTDNDSGTIIQIPAKSGDEHTFERKANLFYRWWPNNAVLLNGYPIDSLDLVSQDYEEIMDDLWIKPVGYGSKITIVMGNVPYVHNFERPSDKLASDVEIIFYAPNGVVQFSPSRESLLMNKTTTKYVESLIDSTLDLYISKISDAISGAKTIHEAVNQYDKYSHVIVDGNVEWNGIKLRNHFRYEGRMWYVGHDETQKKPRMATKQAYQDKSIFLTGIHNINRNHKEAIEKYNASLPDDQKINTVFYGGTIDPIAQFARTVEWETIKPFYISGRANAKDLTYEMYVYDKATDRVTKEICTLPKGKKWKYLYSSPKDIRGGWSNDFYDMAWLKHIDNAVLVVLPLNRHEKFVRDYPHNAKNLYQFIHNWGEKIINSLTDQERFSAKIAESNEIGLYQRMAGKTDDKYIDNAVDGLVSYTNKIKKVQAVYSSLRYGRVEVPRQDSVTKNYFQKTYPLVYSAWRMGYADTFDDEHAVKYINMIYNEKDEKDD